MSNNFTKFINFSDLGSLLFSVVVRGTNNCVVCFYCYLIVFLLFDNNSVYTKLFPRNRIYSTVIVIVSFECAGLGRLLQPGYYCRKLAS